MSKDDTEQTAILYTFRVLIETEFKLSPSTFGGSETEPCFMHTHGPVAPKTPGRGAGLMHETVLMLLLGKAHAPVRTGCRASPICIKLTTDARPSCLPPRTPEIQMSD
jgi:hypothetical protein